MLFRICWIGIALLSFGVSETRQWPSLFLQVVTNGAATSEQIVPRTKSLIRLLFIRFSPICHELLYNQCIVTETTAIHIVIIWLLICHVWPYSRSLLLIAIPHCLLGRRIVGLFRGKLRLMVRIVWWHASYSVRLECCLWRSRMRHCLWFMVLDKGTGLHWIYWIKTSLVFIPWVYIG